MFANFFLAVNLLVPVIGNVEVNCVYWFLLDDYFCYPQGFAITAPNERVLAIHGQHARNHSNADVHGLNFQYQKMPYLPQGFSSFFLNIWSIQIFGGGLTQMTRADFRDLKNLKELIIIFCDIKELPDDVFTDATKLEKVMFQACPLQSLPENIFYHQLNLKEIFLYETNIATISSGLFAVAHNLENIQLNKNEIETFTPGCAEIFVNVPKFDASFNPCTTGYSGNVISQQMEVVRRCTKSCEHVINNLKTYKDKLVKCRTKLQKAVDESLMLLSERKTCSIQQV